MRRFTNNEYDSILNRFADIDYFSASERDRIAEEFNCSVSQVGLIRNIARYAKHRDVERLRHFTNRHNSIVKWACEKFNVDYNELMARKEYATVSKMEVVDDNKVEQKMNKQEIQSKIEELEKRFAKFKELENELTTIKEGLKKPESKVFKPKSGDINYFINGSGEVIYNVWKNVYYDNERYTIGNYFKTKEEAEFEIERLKVIAELKRFALEHNEPIDWGDRTTVRYIGYDYVQKKVCIYYIPDIKSDDIYFSSVEIAKQAIEEIGKDRIKKYYLGVEE